MTPELTMLLYSILLTFLIILVPAFLNILNNGAMAQAGARDNLPEMSVAAKRGDRLRSNMLENMVLFGGLVLVAHASGISNENTILGAQIFFFARVAHAIIYWLGLPAIRPIAWFAGVIGMGLIALQLV